ncbi:MAG: hypothetical protein ACP5G1_02420 [Nanopusillaceae archaeon]
MKSDVPIQILIFMIIGIVVLVVAIFFATNIFKSASTSANTSFNYINSTFHNVTNETLLIK